MNPRAIAWALCLTGTVLILIGNLTFLYLEMRAKPGA